MCVILPLLSRTPCPIAIDYENSTDPLSEARTYIKMCQGLLVKASWDDPGAMVDLCARAPDELFARPVAG